MGDSLAEFSNNLASDLGPLLALFGESMTIQYLSECTNIADYIVFASAPIGIITALVSAIRICGGTYLRAFIGRATEGAAAAEVELCTSTGRDVCELFTRGGITRSLGGPRMLELVFLRGDKGDSGVAKEGELRIYRKYLRECGEGRWPQKVRRAKSVGGWQGWLSRAKLKVGTDDTEGAPLLSEKESSGPEPDTDLPNLSLNVGIVKPPWYIFWIVAAIGVVLQTGVIALAAVDAAGLLEPLAPPEEGEEPPEGPLVRDSVLFILGTVFICFGMGSCAALIGRTTREFVDKKRQPEKERLLWLQPGNQKIGDQTFDCYAIFETRRQPLTQYVISTMDDRRREKMNIHVAAAALITLIGFIAQFIGIRGISAWVSIAQLIVTIIMSLLRGMVRMQRRGKEDNELKSYDHHILGHELDWLAFNLACSDCAKARYSSDGGDLGSGPQLHRGYSFQVTGKSTSSSSEGIQAGKQESVNDAASGEKNTGGFSVASDGGAGAHVADPQAVFDMRVKLANLTGNVPPSICLLEPDQYQVWEAELIMCREKAAKIAQALCDAADILFSDPNQKRSLRLQVGISKLEVEANTHQNIAVELREPSGSTSAGWTIDTAAIEALLGLWLWSITEPMAQSPEGRRALGSSGTQGPSNSARIISTGKGLTHWGRRTYIEGELQLHLGSNAPKVQRAVARISAQSEYGLVNMWPAALDPEAEGLTWQTTMPSDTNPQLGKRFFGWQRADSHLREVDAEERSYPIQYVDTDASTIDLCAQEIYTSLIASMVSSASCRGVDLTLDGKGGDRRLGGADFTAIKMAFVDQELGTNADAVLCLLSAFRDKLHITPTEENAVAIVQDCLNTHEWKQSEPFLKLACLSFEDTNLQRVVRGTGEFYRRLMRENLDFGIKGIEWLVAKVPDSFHGEDGFATVYAAAIERVKTKGISSLPTSQRLLIAEESEYTLEGMVETVYLLCGNPELTVPTEDELDECEEDLEGGILADSLLHALKAASERPWSIWSSVALAISHVAVTSKLYSSLEPHKVTGGTAGSNESCLSLAVDLDDFDLVHFFLKHGVDSGFSKEPTDSDTPLFHAARRASVPMIDLLVPYGTTEEKQILAYRKLLFRSAFDGNVPALLTAIDALTRMHLKIDEKDAEGMTALAHAARWGRPSIISALLHLNDGSQLQTGGARIVDVDTQDIQQRTPLLWAVRCAPFCPFTTHHTRRADIARARAAHDEKEARYTAAVKILIGRRSPRTLALTDTHNMSALNWAAISGSEPITRLLMNRLHDINSSDSQFRTSLFMAAEYGRTDVARALLEHDSVQVNKANVEKQTPLFIAAKKGRTEIVKMLLAREDVYINSRDLEGRSPLWIAAYEGKLHTVRALVRCMAVDLGKVDGFGRTPLMCAAMKGHAEVVKVLMRELGKEGIDAVDGKGWSALALAVREGKIDVVRVLVEEGGAEGPDPGMEVPGGLQLSQVVDDEMLELMGELKLWREKGQGSRGDDEPNQRMDEGQDEVTAADKEGDEEEGWS